MLEVIKKFIAIALFKGKPQDLKEDTNTLVVAMVFALATYVMATISKTGFSQAVLQALLDLIISALFFYGALYYQKRLNRFNQAFSALIGSGSVINVIAIPVLMSLDSEQTLSSIASLFFIFLFGWSLALCAYIFRNTFELNQMKGILAAVIYVFTVINLSQLVFPS